MIRDEEAVAFYIFGRITIWLDHIGATAFDKLNQNIDAFDFSSSGNYILDREALKEISKIRLRCQNLS